MSKKVNVTIEKVILREMKSFRLSQLPVITSYLDTGYDKDGTIRLLKTMYKNYNINFNTQFFVILLFEKIETNQKPEYDLSFSKNWNNKLFLDYFPTIRLWSKKYRVGEVYNLTVPFDLAESYKQFKRLF